MGILPNLHGDEAMQIGVGTVFPETKPEWLVEVILAKTEEEHILSLHKTETLNW